MEVDLIDISTLLDYNMEVDLIDISTDYNIEVDLIDISTLSSTQRIVQMNIKKMMITSPYCLTLKNCFKTELKSGIKILIHLFQNFSTPNASSQEAPKRVFLYPATLMLFKMNRVLVAGY